MSLVVVLVIAFIMAFLVGGLVLVGAHASALARRLAAHAAESRGLVARLAQLEEMERQKSGWIDTYERDIDWLYTQLKERPRIARKTYKILTLGVKATGKTSLTLKWANPLTDLGALEGTKIERYERTVSLVPGEDLVTQHVFEVSDWGGEHIVDAQNELIAQDIRGLLIVVDLGGKDARKVDPTRVHAQHQQFLPQVLQFFLGPNTVASCKTVVLFINKSDLLAGTPAQVEEEARKLYAPLIENLNKYSTQIDVRVFVGSASYGHSTHLLFAHFVERILPRESYDAQLLRGMKVDGTEPLLPEDLIEDSSAPE